MIKANDIMKKTVITVKPDTTIQELGKLFVDQNISGAPVIDDNENLYGIVTENDLISQNKEFHVPTLLKILDAFIPLESPSKMEEEIRRMAANTVGEICSKKVVTIDEETTLTDIATIMTEKKIHLLPVLKDGKIIGIVGKKEVIRGVSGTL